MIILPSAYLPSVEYFAYLQQGDCVIDWGEHYIKRSERNRAAILATDGRMELSAQVAHANRPRQKMKDMRLDYSKRWQHQHWGALVASYKSSPYFDFYAPYFEPFYTREYPSLTEYNMQILETLCRLTHIPLPSVSEEYIVAGEGDTDLRPKKKEGSAFVAEPYIQVFSDRFEFEPNLSFIDLLFCEGPECVGVLERCLRR